MNVRFSAQDKDIFGVSASLVERGVRDEIDSRRSFVPRHEALTEITREVVVGRLWMRPCNAAKAACHSRLHSKTRKFGDDGLHLAGRNELVLQADDIKADAGRA